MIYTDYNTAQKGIPFCIALGNFDGMHLGHMELIKTVVSKSVELDCNSMIYTFKEHPRKLLYTSTLTKIITDNKTKIHIAQECGLKNIYFEDFRNIMTMEPETFIREILVKVFKIKCAVAGYNFHFGINGSGDAETLKYFGEKYGFDVFIIKPVMVNGDIVSSTLVRKSLEKGDIDRVSKYLGRNFKIRGNVVHGMKIGGRMGIRTANISVKPDMIIPRNGVYLTTTIIDQKEYRSVTNIGYNPTFNRKRLSIETHIINFDGYLYDSDIEISFLKRQRDERAFNSIDELKSQINYDIRCRLLL